MISVVNGYVCTTSCEAASAKAGKDPHAPAGVSPGQSSKNGKTSALDSQPATVLGGSLTDGSSSNAIGATSSTAPTNPTSVNRLV